MELPLFPLHVVLFPGRPLALHLFEPRYRQMLTDLEHTDSRFGVVAIRQGNETSPDSDVYTVGTIARLEDVEMWPDGRANITVRGEQRFHIVEMTNGRPYPTGTVEPLVDPEPGDHAAGLAAQVRDALKPYLCGLGAPDELMDHLPTDPVRLGYLAAASLQTDLPDQQELLELRRPEERLEQTLRLLRREQGIARHIGTVGAFRPAGPGGPSLN